MDLYTKSVLTVIAAALVSIVIQNTILMARADDTDVRGIRSYLSEISTGVCTNRKIC
jgi:hypothetical protein